MTWTGLRRRPGLGLDPDDPIGPGPAGLHPVPVPAGRPESGPARHGRGRDRLSTRRARAGRRSPGAARGQGREELKRATVLEQTSAYLERARAAHVRAHHPHPYPLTHTHTDNHPPIHTHTHTLIHTHMRAHTPQAFRLALAYANNRWLARSHPRFAIRLHVREGICTSKRAASVRACARTYAFYRSRHSSAVLGGTSSATRVQNLREESRERA